MHLRGNIMIIIELSLLGRDASIQKVTDVLFRFFLPSRVRSRAEE